MTQPKTKLRASPRPLPQGSFPTARGADDARAVAARVARESYGKLVAYLAAASRDVPGAEDALADAFASALAVWPNQGRAPEPGRLAGEGGAAAPDRRGAQAAHRRPCVGRARADRRRIEGGGRRARRDPGPAPRAHVRLRSSGDRGVGARAVDAADDPRPGRGGDRFGLSGFARDDGPAPLARQGENPPCRRAVQDPRARGFARAARRGAWRRFTPLFRMAGRKRSPTIPAGATSPRRRSGSAASSSPSFRTSPRRWGSWR